MEGIVDVFVRELQGLTEPRTVLILDDYHLVEDVPDIRTVMRVCNVHNVPIATNVAAADLFLASPLLASGAEAPEEGSPEGAGAASR
mgnify:CR=1 FL=1